jgi:hypothetical protein
MSAAGMRLRMSKDMGTANIPTPRILKDEAFWVVAGSNSDLKCISSIVQRFQP